MMGSNQYPPLPSLIREGATHVSCSQNICRAAFTLAEVLITLGIIGVVAAMTMPVLIQKYQNQVTEARLKKFYSIMNQAILASESVNGEKEYWNSYFSGRSVSADTVEAWFNLYFAPYMKIMKTDKNSDGGGSHGKVFSVYFPDGSMLRQSFAINYADWVFYPKGGKDCNEKERTTGELGKCAFLFYYNPNSSDKNHTKKGFEPFKYRWDGDPDKLKQACYTSSSVIASGMNPGAYCTALIQYNGWKIPKDYRPSTLNN